ncbi:glycosyltransferase [Beggiatoa leptomitoformis]|uniref:Glycosyltransferase n=1 Tax=Beggiatoa leptomitoformis TaxID=288004 RepID=A0A2N9YG22_9GAMM|nr:glycosyltransferase [Beggiatoa leptomitoformis]ALG68352.1 glycosyltransferase [Beggiatoa leptomitoformis]AUI69329.1 glycosyltransferase [Beggiatoa leptomitoformis]
MPRILHIGKYFPPFHGGIENFLADLMPAQAQLGDTVAALVHDHQALFTRFFAPVTAEKTQHHQCLYRVPCYGRLLYAPISPQFPLWLDKVINIYQPDILHFHLPNTSVFWALCSKRACQLPWVVHWHSDVISNFHPLLSTAYRFYRPLEQRFLRHAQAIIVTSPPYLSASPALSAWQKKCHVIPLGIAPYRLPLANDEALALANQHWQIGKTRLLSVGRLTYYKGYEILIRAMQSLPQAQLCIVGEGELKPRLAALITALNLHERVKLLGRCDANQLAGLFSSCDIYCLSSLERTEAFGMVLLEAMYYRKPIVASRIQGAGVVWVVEEGETGLLVEPNHPMALANGLQELINNKSYCQQFAEKGYQRFQDLFTIEAVAKKIQSVYSFI